MKKIRIGAINWDASLPKHTYFGGFALRNLGTPAHCAKLPYFTVKTDSGYDFPVRTQEDYDRELRYAIDCGLDFFAYCWYPEGRGERTVGKRNERLAFLEPYLHELNAARRLYQTSPLNRQIGMCAILFSIRAYSNEELEELCEAMRQPYYVRVDGRPLLILYLGWQEEFIRQIIAFMRVRGLDPYLAFINGGAAQEGKDYSLCDAVTAYTSYHDAKSFDELTQKTHQDNLERLAYGRKVIPMLSMGWNPMPRVDQPSPWVEYENTDYADLPNEAEMQRAFADLHAFVDEHPAQADTGLALTFAWNEFEEGGFLCPTLGADGQPDTRLMNAFARIKQQYES